MTKSIQKKCAFITLLGAPNVGKSSLVNTLVGTKISITTPKVQTTRIAVKGICVVAETQLVFVDTPGIFKPKRPLEKNIVKAAYNQLREADTIALVIDAKKGLCKDSLHIINQLNESKKMAILIINKIDLVKKHALLGLLDHLKAYSVFSDFFVVSAKTMDGIDDLKKFFCMVAPVSEWFFPEDSVTDKSWEFYAAETTREYLFMQLDQELPYTIAVKTEAWEENAKSVTIRQVIYTFKASQKAIILGKGGQLIKRISMLSRKSLERSLGKKVHLYLFVKVRENWIEQIDG